MDEIMLIKPSMEYDNDIMSFRQELLEADDEFAGCGPLKSCSSTDEWIKIIDMRENKETCPEGCVTSNTYIAVRTVDNKIIGVIDIRHHIDHPILSVWGGHMGYSVRPSERKKGYAIIYIKPSTKKRKYKEKPCQQFICCAEKLGAGKAPMHKN